MTDVYLENGELLSEELYNLPKENFEIVKREQTISDVEFKTESISYIKDVFKRFVRSKVSVVAALMILLIVVLAIIGPYLNKYDYLTQHTEFRYLPPRIQGLEKLGIFDGTTTLKIRKENYGEYEHAIVKVIREYEEGERKKTTMMQVVVNSYTLVGADNEYYWFGSDYLGRDLFTRLWMGTRISLIMALAVVIVNLSIGLIVGSTAGYYGGIIDLLIMRWTEIMNAIPQLPLTILLIMFFGSGIVPLIIVFVLTGWIGMTYSVRIQFYRFKKMEYVLASRTMGASDNRIKFKYILPNAVGTIITSFALTIPGVIFQEAGLSYLGLGIQAPQPSVGTMLFDGQRCLTDYPFVILYPGIVIVVLMLAFNLFSNGLRDAFNPALRQ